jgi:flagellar biosynthesis protein FliR
MIYDPDDTSPTACVENMWNRFILTELDFFYRCLCFILSKPSFWNLKFAKKKIKLGLSLYLAFLGSRNIDHKISISW